jgi:hypothetical protein
VPHSFQIICVRSTTPVPQRDFILNRIVDTSAVCRHQRSLDFAQPLIAASDSTPAFQHGPVTSRPNRSTDF